MTETILFYVILHTDDPRELRASVLVGDVGMIDDFLQVHLLLNSHFLLCGQEVLVHVADGKVALQTRPHIGDHTHQDEPTDRKAPGSHAKLFHHVTT